MDWGLALSTTAAGMIAVFLVLIILIVIISVLGKIMDSLTHRKKPVKSKKKAEAEAEQASPAPTPPSPQPEVEAGITEEVVAAISAAVAIIMSTEGKSYQIRSVKRAKENRPAWSVAGIQDNTRPF